MNNLISQKSDIIPESIGNMTLNELLASKDVEVHKRKNSLKMKRTTPSESLLVEIRTYEDATVATQAKTLLNKPFNQMGETIAQLRAEGKTQAEVADILGTTPSNICKIEKKMKNNKSDKR